MYNNMTNIVQSVAGGLASKRVFTHRICTYIESTSNQVLKIYLSPTDNNVGTMKQKCTKHVYFSFFNRLKVKANSNLNVYNGSEMCTRGSNSIGCETGSTCPTKFHLCPDYKIQKMLRYEMYVYCPLFHLNCNIIN